MTLTLGIHPVNDHKFPPKKIRQVMGNIIQNATNATTTTTTTAATRERSRGSELLEQLVGAWLSAIVNWLEWQIYANLSCVLITTISINFLV